MGVRCQNSLAQRPQTAAVIQREEWVSAVRSLTGRQKHRFWEPQLDPPALLSQVSVVLVSPKRPVSVGTVARALSCFECEDLRIAGPRCDHLARASRNASKGAQYILWRSQQHDGLESALADAMVSVAFTRWVAGRPNSLRSLGELLATPQFAAALGACPAGMPAATAAVAKTGSGAAETAADLFVAAAASASAAAAGPLATSSVAQPPLSGTGHLALVFGREERGFDPAELDACDFTCSIPIGRLQESLSLSHAVTIVLSQLFQLRQQQCGLSLPASIGELAPRFTEQGLER
eukprot:scaffold21.g2111.t1